jgi:proline iminopeptidase
VLHHTPGRLALPARGWEIQTVIYEGLSGRRAGFRLRRFAGAPAPAPQTRPGARGNMGSAMTRIHGVSDAVARAGRVPVSQNWRVGWGLAFAAAALWALVTGWWTPRGPITTLQAIATIGGSLLVGTFAGRVMATRWAMLLAPAAFVAVFELVRINAAGPLVDGIHLASTLGIIAFVLGRGLHGVLAVAPMLLGVTFGAAVARRLEVAAGPRHGAGGPGLWTRRSVTALATVAMVALSLAIIRPAGTDPILGADGRRQPGSVAELTRVDIGGHSLAMMIRGRSTANPVLLFLAGGPGAGEMGAMRRHGQALEQEFTVVTFDQRGSGKSYDQLDPTSTLTLAAAISDTIGVTNYLRNRFGQKKIYVLGNSWGTILGVLAVQQHPELYRAFIGAGQMVNMRVTDRIFYTDTLAWARRTGNTALAGTLTSNGPPPYADVRKYEPALLTYENEVYPYNHSPNAESAGGYSSNMFVREYSLMEQLHGFAGVIDVFATLYPQLQNIDFRSQVTRLQVPVYLIQGRYEARARAELAQQWFQTLQAPKKQLIIFDTSGHRPLFEQPELFNTVMTDTVLAQTTAAR